MKLKTFFLAIFLLFVGGVCIAVGVVYYSFLPSNPQGVASKFVIAKGSTLSDVAAELEEKGIIRSRYSMRILTKLAGNTFVLQPGTYEISAAMTPKEILRTLQTETSDVWITLKEELRTEEMAEIFAQHLHDTFDPDEFITLAKGKEGTLFPDTYLLSRDSTAKTVLSVLTNTFEKRYGQAVSELGEPDSKEDAVILASLVAREAKSFEDMKMVAGILRNRLEIGMPLQVDATLQYVKGYDTRNKTWWPEARSEDKSRQSPYNTYLNKGLPPTAICNPSLNALKAVLDPTESDYLYYIHDTQDRPHYAVTYEEHQANIAKYLR